MGRIQVLSNDLANKIAAGEVVERPASVVKELLENAIDAKATNINIQLQESGLTEITIIDNGIGMDEFDASLAFKRHATSKIKSEHDLFKILTLGFRGEALPSIAAVSDVDLTTNDTNGAPATHIQMRNGEVVARDKVAHHVGTRISVKNLFYNTPARLKYIRTLYTELGQITDYVQRIMLSHPEISFSLSNGDKKITQSDGSGDILKVIATIYGMEVARGMRYFEHEDADFVMKGYITIPEITRASRNYITLIINGRTVKSYPITKAILDGYHTYLPKERYPIVVLDIKTDPSLIDVNVHPAKLEVRISKEVELQRTLTELVAQALKRQRLIPDAKSKSTPVKYDQPSLDLGRLREKMYENTRVESQVITTTINEPIRTTPIESPKVSVSPIIESKTWKDLPLKETSKEVVIVEDTKPIELTKKDLPLLYPIGQLHGTYIVAQNEEGMFLVDQHAAVERINYEYYFDKITNSYSEIVDLLVPITLEYPGNEFLIIKENLENLLEVGLLLEEFGYHTFVVKGHPSWFVKNAEKELVEQILNQVIQNKKVDIKKLREEMVITLSCKSSLKANKSLSIMEMEVIIDDLRECNNPYTCPHGRPIVIQFSKYEIEKMFKRVM